MADIEIGDAIAAGFGLIRRQPLALLAWSVLLMVSVILLIILVGPSYGALIAAMAQHPGVKPDLTQFSQKMMGLQGAAMLANLVVGFVRVIVYCAVVRAILHPAQKRFAFLRVGAPELFLFVLQYALGIALAFGIAIVALIVIGIVAGFAAAHATAAGVIVAVAAAIGLIYGVVYVLLRLAFVGPMMVADGRFHLVDAWALTKGRTLNLFVIGLSLWVILLVGETVLGLITFAAAASFAGSAAGGFAHLAEMIRSEPGVLLSRMAPVLIILAAVWTFFYGVSVAVFVAPWAKAYQDVARPDPSAVFA